MKFSFYILLICTLVLHTSESFAQDAEEAPPPEIELTPEPEPLPEDTAPAEEPLDEPDPQADDEPAAKDDKAEDEKFTGTFAKDEDPDNPEFENQQREKELFGEDKDEAGADDDSEDVVTSDYTLKLDLNSRLIFSDKFTGFSYMEIGYTTKMETPVVIGKKRSKTEGTMEFTTEVTGTLAGNELFTCELSVEVADAKAQIMTRHIQIEETENEPGKSELAVQIKFKKKPEEDWFSNCSAPDGSKLKTKGDTEAYNAMILESLQPSLNGILFQEYDSGDSASVELVSDTIELDDIDTGNFITMTGSGTLVIEYAGGES